MKIIYLPFAEAVQLEAKQNYERDKRVFEDEEDEMPDFSLFLEEAETILTQYGEGFVPEYDDHYHVFVRIE